MLLRGATGSPRRVWLVLLILTLAIAGLSSAGSAFAQDPAASNQYIPTGPDNGTGASGAGGGTSSLNPCACPAELPFTGYPLTTLALIFLGLLLAGVLLRLVVVIRDRTQRGLAKHAA